MIEISHLTKAYGTAVVVDDFSLTIDPGTSVAFWGPNGAGKTTVVLCILGLLRYDGEITVRGLDAARHGKAVRASIGYVPQELSFYDDLTVDDLLDYSAALRGLPPERLDEVYELVQIGDHRDKLVHELSGGLKQRLGLATALLPDPPILVLDEPTANLDAKARDATIELLQEMRNEGRTLIVTSHHADEVGMLVDSVVAMDAGRITTICDPSELGEQLGLRAWMHLVMRNGHRAEAVEVLAAAGFAAKLNPNGVLLEVSEQNKGRALHALHDAGIRVDDFEVWR